MADANSGPGSPSAGPTGQPGGTNANAVRVTRFDPIWRLQRSTTLALILSPVGVLIIAATRLLIIAGYSPLTASAIVTSDGYVNALLGSVIPVIPILMPYAALVLLFFRRPLLGLLALVTTGLISPSRLDTQQAVSLASRDIHRIAEWILPHWWHHWWIMPIALVPAAILLLAVLSLGLTVFARTLGTLLAVALTVYVAYLYPIRTNGSYYESLLQIPWIPAQYITFKSGKSEIGYVLSDDSVSMEVLAASTRSIVYYPDNLIRGREICAVNAAVARKPLIRLIPAKSTAPPCAYLARRHPSSISTGISSA